MNVKPYLLPIGLLVSIASCVHAQSSDLTMSGVQVLRLSGPQADVRVRECADRLTAILADPSLTASSVVVYAPEHAQAAIYVGGHRFVDVDPASVLAASRPARDLGVKWARNLQQLMSPLDAHEVGDAGASPAVKVTDRITDVGGTIGDVMYKKHLLFRLRTVPTGHETAADRAVLLQGRLLRALAKGDPTEAPDVQVQILPLREIGKSRVTSARLLVNGDMVIEIDEATSNACGAASPTELAQGWLARIQSVIASIPVIIEVPAAKPPMLPKAPSVIIPAEPVMH